MIIWEKVEKILEAMSSFESNWIECEARLFFVLPCLQYCMENHFSSAGVMGDSKMKLASSLLAVDELSGSIYYQHNYITVDANWQKVDSAIGDYYDWASDGSFCKHWVFIFSYALYSAGISFNLRRCGFIVMG